MYYSKIASNEGIDLTKSKNSKEFIVCDFLSLLKVKDDNYCYIIYDIS